MAFWLTAYTGPPDSLQGGVCGFVSAADVAKFTKPDTDEAASALAAEEFLAECRGALVASGIQVKVENSKPLMTVFTKLHTNIGRFLLDKQESSNVKFQSLAEIGRAFVADLKKISRKPTQTIWNK